MSDHNITELVDQMSAIKQARKSGNSVKCVQCGHNLGGDIMIAENRGPMHPKCWSDITKAEESDSQ